MTLVTGTLCSILLLLGTVGSGSAAPLTLADLDVGPPSRIHLKLDHGTLSIEAHDLDRIQVTTDIPSKEFELRINGEAIVFDSTTWERDGEGQPSVSVRLPFWSTLIVETDAAPVEVRGIEGELVRITTRSGAVRLKSSRPSRLEVQTVSGGQIIDGGGLASSRLESILGDIEARGLRGTVQIETHAGEIDAEGDRIQALEITTVSGALRSRIEPRANGLIKLSSHDSDIELTLPASTELDARLYSYRGGMNSDFEALRSEEEDLRVLQGTGTVRAELLSFSGTIDLRAQDNESEPTQAVLVFRREAGQARFANFGFDREVAVALREDEYALVQVPTSAATLFARARTHYADDDFGYSILSVESWGDGLNCFEIRPDYSDTSVALVTEDRGRILQSARQFELQHVECPSMESLEDLRDASPQN